MKDYYVVYGFLVIIGPLTIDEATSIAYRLQAALLSVRLRKIACNSTKCITEQQFFTALNSYEFNNDILKVVTENDLIKYHSDSFEYYITSKIFLVW